MLYSGYGYTVGDVLTVANSYLGGTGSGLQVTVTAITAAGTPSAIIGPEGRCLPGLAYDKDRHVMWLEGGGPRRGWSDNMKHGGLWALDRNATPPTWYLQGPSVSESGLSGMLYNEYSAGLWYDEVGQALYTVYASKIFKYSLAGVAIDGVSRNNWVSFNFAGYGQRNGYPAFDTLRRRLVFWNNVEKATYVWNCATDTIQKLTPAFDAPFDNEWHFTYDSTADRVICWIGKSTTNFDTPGYNPPDYEGPRIKWMYSMDPDGNWTQFTPTGDKLAQDNVNIIQVSGAYDPLHKCIVMLAGNQYYTDFIDGQETAPARLTIHHLMSPTAGPSITDSVWTPARDGSGNVVSTDWAGLPLNTWLDVAGGVMNDVIETPHLLNGSGSDGAHNIIDAWGGAAWDASTNRMYISGGGHGDSNACETGVYAVDTAKLTFSRVVDRQALSQGQVWNGSAFVDGNNQAPYNVPLKNGVPSSWHTYNGLVFLTPAFMGNTNGGVYYHGSTRAIINLDNGTYSTCHWNPPEIDSADWSNQAAFLDGSIIYAPISSWYHKRFDLSQIEATQWSATSTGKWLSSMSANNVMSTSSSSIWGTLPERREEISFMNGGARTRFRYGQAIDAGASVLDAYFDTITLTSTDGSHTDFNNTNLIDDGKLAQCGFCYDHASATLYLTSSTAGGEVYKITGIAGNTWTTEKMTGTGVRRFTAKGAYGRVRLANIAGKKVLVRVASTTTPIEVMRLS